MPESTLWGYVKRGMGNCWHATRHEDVLNKGVPDVSFGYQGINGWIELKSLKAWPKRENTIVRLPKFTMVQRIWLMRRQRSGGNCWILLRVGREYLLISAVRAALVGKVPKRTLEHVAHKVWKGRVDWSEFLYLLCG